MVTASFMFGLLWFVMVRMLRFLEIPSCGHKVTWMTNAQRFYNINNLNNNIKNNNAGEVKHVAGGADMSELQTQSTTNQQHENDFVQADYNSNCPVSTNPTTGAEKNIAVNEGREKVRNSTVEVSHMSTTSSNDEESLTTNDASDYQWFPEYIYGDNSNAATLPHPQHRPSIFSVLNYSSNVHELNYEAISRNIDANLAEIDMEDFRSEDINSILAIPAMYCGGAGDFHSSASHGEQAASLSASIMAHFDDDDYNGAASTDFNQQLHSQQLSVSINSDSTDMSVCKSEQLFSPIKEPDQPSVNERHKRPHQSQCGGGEGATAAPHPTTFSIDSLDCDSYDEQELILTCQTNVDNYTIAFEGSLYRDSEDSDYHDDAVTCETSDTESWYNLNLRHPKLSNFKLRNTDSVDGSLVKSDFVYTTWTKLKHGSSTNLSSAATQRPHLRSLKQHQTKQADGNGTATCNKSQSLPNLCRTKINPTSSFKISQLNISTADSNLDQSQKCIPLYDITTSTSSPSSSLQSLSLMRLFMQNRTTNSSSCSSNGVLFSVSHSLSSATSQHQFDLNTSPTEYTLSSDRLQCFLNSKLVNNNGDSFNQSDISLESQAIASGHAVFKRRAASPPGSPIEEVDESDNTTTTTTSNKHTLNTIKNKNSDDSIEENSANELEIDGTKTATVNELTQGTQTSGSNISGNNNSNTNAVIYVNNNNVQRGDSGVGLSSACTSYGESKNEKRLAPHSPKNRREINQEKINSVTITMFTTRGTQLPVHVCDEAIQTSFKGDWLDRILAKCSNSVPVQHTNEKDEELEKESEEENKKDSDKPSPTIYVCYPNYSLPDLGFLKNISNDELPAKVQLTPKESKKISPRPKSCPGLHSLHPNANDLARIRDWDSLNFLLPQKVKELLKDWRTTDIVEQPSPLAVNLADNNQLSDNSEASNSDKADTPRSILRRSKTESSPEIKKFIVPQTIIRINKDDYEEARKDVKTEKPSNCKCPVIGELTAMLGISLEQCDCENLLDSTLGHLCGIDKEKFSEIDVRDDVKNRKVVSFSPHQNTIQTVNNIPTKSSESNDKAWQTSSEESPPQEFFVSPVTEDISTDEAAIILPRLPVPSYGLTKKDEIESDSWNKQQELLNAVIESVKALTHHFSQAQDPHTKFLIGSGLHTPTTGYKIIYELCPALFNILNDGLQPSVYNIFGHMENSVWMVVETLTQSGKCTKQMSDLVVHVNNEQHIVDKRMKFNAFVFGLLNIRSLATWFSLLGSSEQILLKHYSTSAFLFTATTNSKFFFDELLISLQTLSLLPFDLNLALEFQVSDETQQIQNSKSPHYKQQQPHRICLSSSPLKLKMPKKPCNPLEEKSKSKHSKSSKLVRGNSCGLLIDELVKDELSDKSDDDEKKSKKSQSLRRGLSQDSAMGTSKSTSECLQEKLNHIPSHASRSSEEHREGWALKDLPKRPWSYAQDVDFEFEISSRNSSKEMCSTSSGENNSASSSKDSKDINEIVSACKQHDPQIQTFEEMNDMVDNAPKLMLGETEKGSLDARIAERIQFLDENERTVLSNEKEISPEDADSVQFKQLQMRWEILSSASPGLDRKRLGNPNLRSKIPRLVMQMPSSPLPKLKKRNSGRQLCHEQLSQPTVVVNSSCAGPISNNSTAAATTNRSNSAAKTTAVVSSDKSPVKKRPNGSMSRVALSSATIKTKRNSNGDGTTRGASGGVTDDAPN